MNKRSVMNILKEAYKEELISKKNYEEALKFLDQSVNEKKPTSVVEIKLLSGEKTPYLSFKLGKIGDITLPLASVYEALKRTDDLISILTNAKLDTGARFNPESMSESAKGDKIGDEDLKKPEAKKLKMSFSEEAGGKGSVMLTKHDEEKALKDLGLKNMKEEFSLSSAEEHIEKPEEETKEKSLKDEIKLEKDDEKKKKEKTVSDDDREGIFTKIKNKIIGEKKKSEYDKLKILTLKNLKKISSLTDNRELVVTTARVLKQFMEIKFGIQRELTYMELVNEIKQRNIDPGIKEELIQFFTKVYICEYSTGFEGADFGDIKNKSVEFVNSLYSKKFNISSVQDNSEKSEKKSEDKEMTLKDELRQSQEEAEEKGKKKDKKAKIKEESEKGKIEGEDKKQENQNQESNSSSEAKKEEKKKRWGVF